MGMKATDKNRIIAAEIKSVKLQDEYDQWGQQMTQLPDS